MDRPLTSYVHCTQVKTLPNIKSISHFTITLLGDQEVGAFWREKYNSMYFVCICSSETNFLLAVSTNCHHKSLFFSGLKTLLMKWIPFCWYSRASHPYCYRRFGRFASVLLCLLLHCAKLIFRLLKEIWGTVPGPVAFSKERIENLVLLCFKAKEMEAYINRRVLINLA